MNYTKIFKKLSHFDTDVGRVIPMSQINQILFANIDPFCIIGKFTLINSDIIVKLDNKFQLVLSKLDKYLEFINKQFCKITFMIKRDILHLLQIY